jgi:hypothetical protein
MLGVSVLKVAHYGHAFEGQFMIFCWNVCPVNEQKADIFIMLLNREFSAGTTAQQRTKS